MMPVHKLSLFVVSATTAALVAACGAGSSSTPVGAASATAPSASRTMAPSASAAAHDTADVTFATDMISHHRQAVTMADLAATAATTAAVKSLAAQIKAAQSPEISEMSTWLTAWGIDIPAEGMDMGMAGMQMPGLMTGAQMNELKAAAGAAFDRLWLQMMVSHHEGAITMAKNELSSGKSTEARRLAQSIITSQQSQIVAMNTLLAG